MRKRVLLFLESGCGGSELMTVKIGKYLDTSIFEPIFIIVGHNQDRPIVKFVPKEYHTDYIFSDNYHDWMISQFAAILKKYKPNIIFCSAFSVSCRLIIVNLFTARAIAVIRCNTSLSNLKGKSKWYIIGKLTYRYADIVIAQSSAMKAELENLFHIKSKKLMTIQNPIDTKLIDSLVMRPSPYPVSNKRKIVSVSRVSPEKGIMTLIKAFKLVVEKEVNSILYIVGDYSSNVDYYKHIVEYIEKEKLMDSIMFMGVKENPFIWVKYADCFVLSSPIEGLPNALIEASYIGTPVVSTDCAPIIHQIIQSGINGYIVPVDDPDSMAESIIKALPMGPCKMFYTPGSFEDYNNMFVDLDRN